MAITTTKIQQLTDSIAKLLTDTSTAVTGLTSNAPTISTMTAGITSQAARVAGFNAIDDETALAAAVSASGAAYDSFLATLAVLSQAYPTLYVELNALETWANGLSGYLATNSVQVHKAFADAFNSFAANARNSGLRLTNPVAIAPANIFPAAAIDPVAAVAVTGAAAGTFTAGTAVDTTQYGALPLYLQNSSAGASAAATVFHITYVGADGASHTVDKTITVSMGTGAGNAVTLGVTGTAVTAISITSNGTNGESYHVTAPLVRTPAY